MRWHNLVFKYLKRVIFFYVSPEGIEGPKDEYYLKRPVSVNIRNIF